MYQGAMVLRWYEGFGKGALLVLFIDVYIYIFICNI